jgi:hypothetical protein
MMTETYVSLDLYYNGGPIEDQGATMEKKSATTSASNSTHTAAYWSDAARAARIKAKIAARVAEGEAGRKRRLLQYGVA